MKLNLFVTLVAFSFVASAAYKGGSQCGLVDSTNEEEGFVETASRGLDRSTSNEVAKLPTLTKQQLIISAKLMAKESSEPVEIKNTYDAVVYLRDNGRGLTIVHAKAGKTKVTEIRTYPGDNPYGPIFLQGTKTIVAFENDGDIVCK